MASLISRLQKRYILEGDQLAHDAETVIGELCAALRKIADMTHDARSSTAFDAHVIASNALRKCAEEI